MSSIVKALVLAISLFYSVNTIAQSPDLRIVLIRHGEKPPSGDGLTCQGINRSQQLVGLLYSRFGLPGAIYIPNKGKHDTQRSRMYQTVQPFAAKYRLPINADYHEDELKSLATTLRQQRGLVLVVWEHSGIPAIARDLGVDGHLSWKDADYDSIWMVRFVSGHAVLTKDKEGLTPSAKCP